MAGKLYTWGAAGNGRLGNGTTTPDVLVPTQIGTDITWDKISVGNAHCLAIKSGALFAWGDDGDMQIGNGATTGNVTSPVQIGSDTDWTDVAAGRFHSLGIRNGRLFAWGDTSFGAVGNGTTTPKVNAPAQIGSDTDWQKVAAGQSISLAIKGGQLYGWGINTNGQVGDNSTTQRNSPVLIDSNTDWTHISCLSGHAVAIRAGRLYTWGRPDNGRLGNGLTTGNVLVPTQIGSNTDWTDCSAGDGFGLGIRDGRLFSWGNPASGRLGNGTTTGNVLTPTQVGTATDWVFVSAGQDFAYGLRSNSLFSWGSAANGRVGNNTTTPNVTSPVQISTGITNWSIINAGETFGAALTIEAPANTAAPAVTGTAQVGQTLTASNGTWTNTPTSYSYQWQESIDNVSFSNISGATSSTFTLTSGQAGEYVRARVTATNAGGSTTASSASTAQVTQAPTVSTPTISGTSKVGQTLTASASATAGFPSPSLSYQWQSASTSDGSYSNISGATSSTFTLTNSEAGKYIKVSATATNSEGNDTKTSAATSQVLQDPANTALPSISYTDDVLQVGSQLTSSPGSWDGVPSVTYAYQWEISNDGSTGWSNVASATSSTLTVPSLAGGKYLRLKVVATNSEGSATAYSTATGYISEDPVSVVAPTITGSAALGETLQADPGTWTGFPEPNFTFNWQRSANGSSSWQTIGGANTDSYVIGENDQGKFLRVLVQGSNNAGEASAASAPVGPVEGGGSNATAAIVGALVASGAL